MVVAKRFKLPIFILVAQLAFILIFAFLAEYDGTAQPKNTDTLSAPVPQYYPMFQDVHVMMFIGFGFLMTFLKRYGFSAVGINMLIAAFCLQWATIVRGFIHSDILGGEKFKVHITEMLSADFAAATVLISFGALLGKTSPLQLLIMATIEIIFAQINEYIGVHIFHAVDIGESMYVHVFGAYFGLAVARVLFNEEVESSNKEGSVYHSDIFAMIGTVFLWLYWPSFNGGAAEGDEQHRAVLNTYFSLAGCCIVTFAISGLLDKKGKFDMVHVQNATLAGGVAVGTCANMPMEPWGALVLGSVAAIISVIGYKYITPFLSSKLRLHDTCGVNNLHGMPGILAGIAGAVMAALATQEKYGESLSEVFPARAPEADNTTVVGAVTGQGRTAGSQGGYQAVALIVSLGIAIVGGLLTGLLLKIPFCDNVRERHALFEDEEHWHVPEEEVTFLDRNYEHVNKNVDTKIRLLQ
ncbi:hypothetical protein SNE40_016457 [Patella caerulea]|uniref:Ammonium transporter AmtB-like domain-containing protein n=1 Tax=Patella caerulea TaxID=87958 RepID=A0AAN8P871_PATCE